MGSLRVFWSCLDSASAAWSHVGLHCTAPGSSFQWTMEKGGPGCVPWSWSQAHFTLREFTSPLISKSRINPRNRGVTSQDLDSRSDPHLTSVLISCRNQGKKGGTMSFQCLASFLVKSRTTQSLTVQLKLMVSIQISNKMRILGKGFIVLFLWRIESYTLIPWGSAGFLTN